VFKRLIVVFALMFCVVLSAHASARQTSLIDTPTTNVLGYTNYNMQFRFFGHGGLMTTAEFGIFNNINIGVSWELANFLGNDRVTVAMPALLARVRLYSGNINFPSIAIGYSGQGYFWNTSSNEFVQDPRGLYIVGGKEVFFPTLIINFGFNVNSLSDMRLFAFTGASVDIIENRLSYMLEWDNINTLKDSRVNTGLRFFAAQAIALDFYFRDIFAGSDRPGRARAERIVSLSHQRRF